MKRLWPLAALIIIILYGCPPPVTFNILNNTSNKLVIHAPDEVIVLAPGGFIESRALDLIHRRREGEFLVPIVQVEYLDRMWEYDVPLRVNEEWRNGWTFLLQVDPDLAIRIAKPEDTRPVPIEYSQPDGWPLTVNAEVTPTSEVWKP